MSILLLGNLDAKTTDEEIGAFLLKYGFPDTPVSNTWKATVPGLPCG